MMRFGFLAKNLSRSFAQHISRDILVKAEIDTKYLRSKNFESFINDLEISKLSLPMLAYSLQFSIDNPKNISIRIRKKYFQIIDEIKMNLGKLDPQSIVNFSKCIVNCELLDTISLLSQEQKSIYISRINTLISSHSFDREQILTLYENLIRRRFNIKELENEVEKIVSNPSTLTLKEISQIIIGSDQYLYTRYLNFFYSCMKKISELSNQDELDPSCLAKILDVLAIKSGNMFTREILENFVKIIDKTLPRWSESDLLSIINFYKSHKQIDKHLYFRTLERIDELINEEQPIEIESIIKLISLLKEESNKNTIFEKIVSKCSKIINSKLSGEFVGVENLSNVLNFIGPIIDNQVAHLLDSQINDKNILCADKFKLFQKASYIDINKEGKLSPLADVIQIDNDYKRIQYLMEKDKLKIFDYIVNTKNYALYDLEEIKNKIIGDLRIWLTRNNNNVKEFCEIIKKHYSSELAKNLKSLQSIVYGSILRIENSKKRLYYSMMLYESNPKKWEEFVYENKNLFQECVLYAIRFYKGPFEAIIYLLKLYINNYSPFWIGAAMQRVTEVQNIQVLNEFACILNKIDPHYLLDEQSIYARRDCFIHLFKYSDFSLLSDLFAGVQNLLKNSPPDTIFRNYNIKYLSYAALLGQLDTKLANFITSNYAYMNNLERWAMLMISSKCDDTKLREGVIKAIFNDKLEMKDIGSAIIYYNYHPKNEEIENYIIETLKKIIPNSDEKGIFYMSAVFNTLLKENISNHLNLFNALSIFTKELVLKNVYKFWFTNLEDMLSLADMNIDLDFADIMYKSQQFKKSNDSNYYRERLIEKIRTVGLSEKKAIEVACNKKNNFNPAYLSGTISCLADLRLQNEKWAIEIAKNLVNYSEDNKTIFESDAQYTNWIYGLLSFNVGKSVIMRHLENSKYFDVEQPNFKHFLLANHFFSDPDYRETKIYEQKTDKYLENFDYFKHFGIDKPLTNHIISSFNKDNPEIKSGEFVEGVWVPFYIPEKKLALWPVTKSILLYRSNIFRGEFAMHQNQILRKVKDLIIFNREETNRIDKLDIKKRIKEISS